MKTTSLKALLPDVGHIFGISPHVLYLRQQALVREGLLPVQPGRGPGSGVVASPETVAVLVIALLASVSLADAPEQTKAFCAALSAKGACPLTGQPNLKSALTSILAKPKLAERVNEILVGPSHGSAFIRYDGKPFDTGPEASAAGQLKSSVFVAVNHPRSPLSISVSIYADTIQSIAALVAKLEADQ